MSGNLNVTTTAFDTEIQSRLDAVTSATPTKDLIKLYRASELYDAADYTVFASEVQGRLNAVDGTTDGTELLKLAASFGKIDNTNQESLQSALLALAEIPTNNELATALSPLATSADLEDLATKEDLAGSGSRINTVNTFHTHTPRIEKDGQVWLQTGYVDDDLASYPDATIGYNFTDFSFRVGNQDTIPKGISVDNTHVWVVGGNSYSVYQYDKITEAYTGFEFSVASQDTNPQGISVDDTHVWVVGGNSRSVYQYDKTTGTYTGFDFRVGTQDTLPQGISVDDTHIWIIGSSSNSVHQYDKTTGAYTGFSFSVSAQDVNQQDISVDNTYVWTIGHGSDSVHQYDKTTGAYTGFEFSVVSQESQPYGISVDDTHIWVVGGNARVYQYSPAVGIIDAKTDSDTGLPYYVRIK